MLPLTEVLSSPGYLDYHSLHSGNAWISLQFCHSKKEREKGEVEFPLSWVVSFSDDCEMVEGNG